MEGIIVLIVITTIVMVAVALKQELWRRTLKTETVDLNREEWLEVALAKNAAEIKRVSEELQYLEIDRTDLVYLQENRSVHGFGNTLIPEASRHSSLPPVEGIFERKRPWN